MKRSFVGILLVMAVAVLCGSGLTPQGDRLPSANNDRGVPQQEPAVVAELFTSEGCSSCPPAEELLSEMAREFHGEKFYPLAFHVDYWNTLGWKDPFSDPVFSERQRRYSITFGERRVYTPQLIVNGRDEMVGSKETEVREAIERYLRRKLWVQLMASAKWDPKASTCDVEIELKGIRRDSDLCVAYTETGVGSRITSGENQGRTLYHDHVVRSFARIEGVPADTTIHVLLPLPSDARIMHSAVVVYVQDQGIPVVRGATRVGVH